LDRFDRFQPVAEGRVKLGKEFFQDIPGVLHQFGPLLNQPVRALVPFLLPR